MPVAQERTREGSGRVGERGGPLSRRERKKQATREALHRAAVDLTAEHGLAGVTIEAITEAADVAPRTFFNYFSSKEEAVLGHDPERVDRVVRGVLNRPADEPVLDSLREVMVAELLAHEPTVEGFRGMLMLVTSDPHLRGAQAAMWSHTEQALASAVGIRTGLDLAKDIYPALVASVAMAATRSAVLRWANTGGEAQLADLVAEACDWLAAGLPEPVGHGKKGPA